MFGLQAVGYWNIEGYLTTHLLTSRFSFKCSFPILGCASYLIEIFNLIMQQYNKTWY